MAVWLWCVHASWSGMACITWWLAVDGSLLGAITTVGARALALLHPVLRYKGHRTPWPHTSAIAGHACWWLGGCTTLEQVVHVGCLYCEAGVS
jgi:CRISPR/Cas system-associated exonuclease Cas4 (RecB family)